VFQAELKQNEARIFPKMKQEDGSIEPLFKSLNHHRPTKNLNLIMGLASRLCGTPNRGANFLFHA